MSLALIGTKASYEFRWRRWSLLRDVVSTHLEHAKTGSRYPQFASIGRALGGGSLMIPAAALAAELAEVRAQLAELSVERLVITPATAHVLYPNTCFLVARPLTRAEQSQIAPIGAETTLDRYFASMLDSMLEVCAHPGPDGQIEVVDA